MHEHFSEARNKVLWSERATRPCRAEIRDSPLLLLSGLSSQHSWGLVEGKMEPTALSQASPCKPDRILIPSAVLNTSCGFCGSRRLHFATRLPLRTPSRPHSTPAPPPRASALACASAWNCSPGGFLLALHSSAPTSPLHREPPWAPT